MTWNSMFSVNALFDPLLFILFLQLMNKGNSDRLVG